MSRNKLRSTFSESLLTFAKQHQQENQRRQRHSKATGILRGAKRDGKANKQHSAGTVRPEFVQRRCRIGPSRI
jgi:hypothetical protein